MNAPRERLQSRHWFGKTCAGGVLGFTLALALSGLIALLTPGGLAMHEGKLQFTMWILAPLWAAVLGGVYLFRDSLRAWLWLGTANLAAFGLFWLLRTALA
ncbi:MAG: hypothetical protein QM581_07900 [Pseudomonas sp.]